MNHHYDQYEQEARYGWCIEQHIATHLPFRISTHITNSFTVSYRVILQEPSICDMLVHRKKEFRKAQCRCHSHIKSLIHLIRPLRRRWSVHDIHRNAYRYRILYSSAAIARAGKDVSVRSPLSFAIQDSDERTVDAALAVSNDLLDDALLLQISQSSSCDRSVDLHSVDKDGDGDKAVWLDILVELVWGGLLEDNGVLGLVLDLTLAPVMKSVLSIYFGIAQTRKLVDKIEVIGS